VKVNRRTLLIGAALILATNAVALIGVAYNRSGDPDSTLVLTQRELIPPYDWGMQKENSGIALQLQWRTLGSDFASNEYAGHWSAPAWLDKARMASLGFDVSAKPTTPSGSSRYRKQLAKEVLLVMEFNGSTYREALNIARKRVAREQTLLRAYPEDKALQDKAKAAQEALRREENENSRLFIMDAGLDLNALRVKYPDRSTHLIQRGTVRPNIYSEASISGQIESLAVERIHVPSELMRVFDLRSVREQARPPKPFDVTVAIGRRLEPWITAVNRPAQ
jgi:hypothetical protein